MYDIFGINERLAVWMRSSKMNAPDIARLAEVDVNSVYHIIKKRNKVSMEFALKILHAFPDMSAEWFIRGEGASHKQFTDSDIAEVIGEENSGLKEQLERQNRVIDTLTKLAQ